MLILSRVISWTFWLVQTPNHKGTLGPHGRPTWNTSACREYQQNLLPRTWSGNACEKNPILRRNHLSLRKPLSSYDPFFSMAPLRLKSWPWWLSRTKKPNLLAKLMMKKYEISCNISINLYSFILSTKIPLACAAGSVSSYRSVRLHSAKPRFSTSSHDHASSHDESKSCHRINSSNRTLLKQTANENPQVTHFFAYLQSNATGKAIPIRVSGLSAESMPVKDDGVSKNI